MIKVHRLDGSQVVINASMIEMVEAVPDTLIKLTTGRHLFVEESVDTVIERVIEYQRKILPDRGEEP
ncbi:MAG: flagellar FlbD family protein [Limnochordia bacterium]